MSVLPLGVSVASVAAQGLLSVLFQIGRSIGGIEPDVTVEEHHSDELAVTENPVERGASIADHAFLRPKVVVIRAGFSNSSLGGIVNGFLNPSYVQAAYDRLLALQADFANPFNITTGKRRYTNMVMTRLSVSTDERTEYALMATIECREVIRAVTVVVPIDTSRAVDPATAASKVPLGPRPLLPGTAFREPVIG